MAERISMVLPELNPEVQQLNKERKNYWTRSGFDHIGSTKNGSFTREWNARDFKDQIRYLKTEPDLDFYSRVILQDKNMRDVFVKKLGVSPDEYWQNADYVREDEPGITKEEYLEKHFWKSLAIEPEVQDILRNSSDDFLLETLKTYNKEINRIRKETLGNIDQMRQDFMPNFKDFVQRYDLAVNWSEIEHKFNTVSYDLFDQYYSKSERDEYKTGDYDKDSHVARVEISPFSRVPFGTLQHEHLHAISGRKNVLELFSRGLSSDNQVYITRRLPRLGASFDRSRSHPERFRWLNEAITEDINVDIKKNVLKEGEYFEFEDSYDRERELFKLILAGGKQAIPAQLFYQAYFESDTDNPADLKRRQELYQAISEAYGSPRFLVELDDMIKKIGIKKASEIFKSAGQAGVREWWLAEFVDKK